MRALVILLAASLIAAGLIVVWRDPEEPLAVIAFVSAVALAAGDLVAMALLRRARRGRRGGPGRLVALRRGAEAAAVIGLLLMLRVVDGLSPVTAGFVVVAVVGAEIALVARDGTSSR